MTEHLVALLLCPSATAVDNLAREGITRDVHLVGDVIADALNLAVEQARARSDILNRLRFVAQGYLLATVYCAENTDDPARLRAILSAFDALDEPLVFSVHPRTRKLMESYQPPTHVQLIEPLGYLDMVRLEQAARLILTDLGGIQKEACWLGVPCITLRDETEWVETVEAGWNILVGANTVQILTAIQKFISPIERPLLYEGDGHAAERCVISLAEHISL